MAVPEEWLPGLQQPEVQAFILEHEGEDPYALSLKFREIAGVDFKIIARQLAARQKARSRLPQWYATPGNIFPPPENLEQASSEATAKYKSGLMAGDSLADLTGGTGIDTFYLSENFTHTTYIEQDAALADIAEHNFSELGASIEVVKSDAETYLRAHTPHSHYFIDPSRRNEQQKRLYNIHDCAPDVTALAGLLPDNARMLIKLSPMLDIQQTCRDLESHVEEIHVVAVANEVKELLFLRGNTCINPPVHAVNIQKDGVIESFRFNLQEEASADVKIGPCEGFIYESNAAIRKSGAFKLVAARFGLKKLGMHTHLYTSDEIYSDFPGRIIEAKWHSPYHPGKLRKQLGITRANIQARNFPEEVKEIRKKTKLQDGGKDYLFFYRDAEDKLTVTGGPKIK